VKNDCDNEKNDVSINHVSNHLLSLIYLWTAKNIISLASADFDSVPNKVISNKGAIIFDIVLNRMCLMLSNLWHS
jgi:hypothetical protein